MNAANACNNSTQNNKNEGGKKMDDKEAINQLMRTIGIVLIALMALGAFLFAVTIIQENKLCYVSFEGDIAGKLSLNNDYINSFENILKEFTINRIDSRVEAIIPCKMITERIQD